MKATDFRDRHDGRAAGRRHTADAACTSGVEEDGILGATPAHALWVGDVTHNDRRSATHQHFLDLLIGHERQRLTIRGEQRKVGAFGSCYRLTVELVEAPKVQQRSRSRPARYANWRPSGEMATRLSTSPGNGSAAATRTRVTGPPRDVADDSLENQPRTPASTAATSAATAARPTRPCDVDRQSMLIWGS
jgi:hypothetical protein